ncbi:hypothetical protein [uncultured Rubinisphaera sp.]|uniref:hypothetical protein n=1 Tax=uncultured Rubinisphaera sp. TaxID=1678686 RepID=UPI0030DD79FB
MNHRDDLLVADLSGFLRAFEWVNAKCDNGFTFRVNCVDGVSDVALAVAKQFASENSISISTEEIAYSREFMSKVLTRWLLCYLNDPVARDRLQDTRQNFSLSHPDCHSQLLSPILETIERLVAVRAAYKIELTTKGHYACDSDDIVIAGDDRMLFFHFSVSD